MPIAVKKPILLVLILLALLAYSNVVSSSPASVEATIVDEPKFYINKEAPELTTKAYAVFDLHTGEVLLSKNREMVLPIASITKLVTATALQKYEDLEKMDTVTGEDLAALGRAGKLSLGETFTYRELIFPLLLESSNDAAAFFERTTAGQVVDNMNMIANEWKMKDTKFSDASGLSDQNVSTINDLIIFLSYLQKEQPHVLDISRLEQYLGTYTGWINNSPVITSSYKGGKHGFTEAAGRTLGAIFEEEISGTKRNLGYLLLGSNNLVADMAKLRAFVADAVVFE
jgi:D-alanyl-D-alanine carboxypeptidase